MAGGGGGGLVVRVWKEWGIEILVVTSFLLQLVLLVFGGFRRRSSSAVLLAFLWLSYLMADNIAVYALGHMTLESRPQDTGLVAFWATFFLLHLGGQDTITAFSMEDNQLWRRHLLTLVVQASGAGYAIYRYIIPGTWTLVSATIVMFIVGFIKYGERVWALQRGGTDTFDMEKSPSEIYPVIRTDMVETEASKMDGEEVILLDAHSMFHFCKSSFFNISQKFRFVFAVKRNSLPYKCNIYMYDLIEAELSLLYDMFYTKAQLVHTWQGCFIRVISLIGTVSAFLLFHLDGKDAYNRVDISITYLLSVGAIILETTSVFRLLGSTWTCEYLNGHGWKRIISMVMCVRGLLKVRSQRRWLHSIGQHNMLEYCTRKQTKCTSITAQATVLKKWWRKVNFSGNIPITVKFKKLVLARIFRTFIRCKTLRIWDAQGKAVLTQYGILDDFRMYVEGNPFSDCVHNWHIATDIYFYCCNDPHHEDDKPLVEAIKVLSNYMGFLMIHHPSLLPGGVQQDIGTVILEETWQDSGCSTSKEFSKSLVEDNDEDNIVFCPYALLAGKLLENEKGVPMLQVIFGVWVEFLSYAAHHSTEVSHVKQLGRGGEFLTVIRLVLDHVELFQKHMVETLTTGCGDDSPINLAGLDATIVHSLESLRVDCEYGPTI